jgi:hypothetical protein
MKYFKAADMEKWRIGILSELFSETLEIPVFTSYEIEHLKS